MNSSADNGIVALDTYTPDSAIEAFDNLTWNPTLTVPDAAQRILVTAFDENYITPLVKAYFATRATSN